MSSSSTEFHYTSYFVLNRDYFSECFDESAQLVSGPAAYRKAVILFGVGAALFFTEISAYATWFLMALGGVELLSIRFQRSWWIMRQMFSRASGGKVNLTLNEQGITTESHHYQQSINWADLVALEETAKGFVAIHGNGRSYLSKSGLEDIAIDYLQTKLKAQS